MESSCGGQRRVRRVGGGGYGGDFYGREDDSEVLKEVEIYGGVKRGDERLCGEVGMDVEG